MLIFVLIKSLHYGLRADILKKVIRKCLTLKIDFSANFNLTDDFFGRGSLNTPKIEKRKNEFTNINLRGCKTKKT